MFRMTWNISLGQKRSYFGSDSQNILTQIDTGLMTLEIVQSEKKIKIVFSGNLEKKRTVN